MFCTSCSRSCEWPFMINFDLQIEFGVWPGWAVNSQNQLDPLDPGSSHQYLGRICSCCSLLQFRLPWQVWWHAAHMCQHTHEQARLHCWHYGSEQQDTKVIPNGAWLQIDRSAENLRQVNCYDHNICLRYLWQLVIIYLLTTDHPCLLMSLPTNTAHEWSVMIIDNHQRQKVHGTQSAN